MMTKERFEQTAHNCIHKGAYRRLPESDGGLGLCPRLKEGKA